MLSSIQEPQACPRVYAVDVSSYGVAYTRKNAERLGVADAVEVRQGSWCEPLLSLTGRLGGLVSNPPYIPEREMHELQSEVGLHEPALALHGGPGDGLDSLICVVACAQRLLLPGGFVALEVCMLLVHWLTTSSRDVYFVLSMSILFAMKAFESSVMCKYILANEYV